MSTKTRPSGCCELPVIPIRLPQKAQDQLISGFKALGDPTRLEIFRLIAAQDSPICACDVSDRFDVSQPTVSHHLKVLKEAGLITVSRRGVWAYYQADAAGVEALRRLLNQVAPAVEAAA